MVEEKWRRPLTILDLQINGQYDTTLMLDKSDHFGMQMTHSLGACACREVGELSLPRSRGAEPS